MGIGKVSPGNVGKDSVMQGLVIKEHIPCSWFHPKGIHKVVEKLKPRLPNVNRCLFVTLTLDRAYFHEQWMGPSEAYDLSRAHIRKVFHKLRKGIKWEGKIYKVKAPYCTKVEFHDDPEGWPHFHIVWLTRKYVPAELLASLWGFGRVNLKRITNSKFNYILKYVCKSGHVPIWVRRKKGIRIFQSGKGFLRKIKKNKTRGNSDGTKVRRVITTIGQRIDNFGKTALLIDDRTPGVPVRYTQIQLNDNFKTLLDRLVYSIARDGRYLGDGKIQIIGKEDFYPWINPPNQ